MLELRILVECDSLLPVRCGTLSHDDLKCKLKDSPTSSGGSEAWDNFVNAVAKTTYVSSREEHTGTDALPSTLV